MGALDLVVLRHDRRRRRCRGRCRRISIAERLCGHRHAEKKTEWTASGLRDFDVNMG